MVVLLLSVVSGNSSYQIHSARVRIGSWNIHLNATVTTPWGENWQVASIVGPYVAHTYLHVGGVSRQAGIRRKQRGVSSVSVLMSGTVCNS